MEEILTQLREKYKDCRVVLGLPSAYLVDQRFNQDLWELHAQTSLVLPMGRANSIGSRIAYYRNKVVESAKILNATHILWIDADSRFPTNGLLRLLSHDKDIVCATTCSKEDADKAPIAEPMPDQHIEPYQKLVKMMTVGMPFMLTKMSVFDKMRKPYFAEPPIWMLGQESDDLLGEDAYFCVMARNAGFDIWCDMELTMEIGHIGTCVNYVKQSEIAPSEAKVDIKLGESLFGDDLLAQVNFDNMSPLEKINEKCGNSIDTVTYSDEQYHRERDGLGE